MGSAASSSSGTALVKDVNPGLPSSIPRSLTDLKGTLFFAADDGVSGTELWRSDGRTGGTFRVQDIAPGALGSGPIALTAMIDLLYFVADEGVTGQELWAADFIFGNGFEPAP